MKKQGETPLRASNEPQKQPFNTQPHKIQFYSAKYHELMAQDKNKPLPQTQQPVEIPYNFMPQQETIFEGKKAEFQFVNVKLLGVGATAFVRLVLEDKSKLILCKKQITKNAKFQEMRQSLMRQIKYLSFLRHPNIIQLYHIQGDQNHLRIYLEYAGDSLFTLKEKNSRFKGIQLEQIVFQLLDALEYLHRQQIVHADIKLQNIGIIDGFIKLMDFGLAHKEKTDPKKIKITEGTLEYLPPEYVKEINSGTKRDIWAVGILIFEMLTGRHPFETRVISEGIPILKPLTEAEKWSLLLNNKEQFFFHELRNQVIQENKKLQEMQSIAKSSEKGQILQQINRNSLLMQLARQIFRSYQRRKSARQLLEMMKQAGVRVQSDLAEVGAAWQGLGTGSEQMSCLGRRFPFS